MINRLFLSFIILYPFMIYPWGIMMHYSLPKFLYLSIFCSLLWVILVYKILMKQNTGIGFFEFKYIHSLIIILFSLLTLSTFLSVDVSHSLNGEYLRYEGLATLLSYGTLLFFTIHFAWKYIIKQIHLLAISALLVSVYGILQHFHLDFIVRPIEKAGWTRSYAFFDNPNFFGSYLVLMFFLVLSLFFNAKSKLSSLSYILIVGTIFAAALYTQTRSAWLAIFLCFILYCAFLVVKRKEMLKKGVVLLTTLIMIIITIQLTENANYISRADSIIKDATEMFTENDGNAGSGRWFIWKNALPLVNEYFWIGSGPDTFGLVFPHDEKEIEKHFNRSNLYFDKAHNEYLQIAITMGVPALLVYLALLGLIVYSSVKALFRFRGKQQLIMLGLLLAIVGYMIQAFFNISVISVAPYFWIFLGLAYRYSLSDVK